MHVEHIAIVFLGCELERWQDHRHPIILYKISESTDGLRPSIGELHDTTGQNLSMLVLNIDLLSREQFPGEETRAKLAECRDLARTSLQEVRTFSYVLHPPLLDELGVFSALRTFIQGFAERTGILVDVELPDRSIRIPRELETTIFRVVQESLSNVHKHSHSSTARVRTAVNHDGVFISVEDEGTGFPASAEITELPAKIGVWNRQHARAGQALRRVLVATFPRRRNSVGSEPALEASRARRHGLSLAELLASPAPAHFRGLPTVCQSFLYGLCGRGGDAGAG